MRQGKFTTKERAYLMTLPAVESVTQERIFYSERFKAECMRRYHAGESPTKIFNDAGLNSSLIGYKRIERCIARWRADERAGRLDIGYETGDSVVDGLVGATPAHAPYRAELERNARWAGGMRSNRSVQDVSGLLLTQYESRLRTLEKRILTMSERINQMESAAAQNGGDLLSPGSDASAANTDARVWIMEDMRVIAGRFKGLELKAAKSGTRPTTDRTKEAIFSRLESWNVLEDARVLDLFAGTGALGIEALSRGAKELVSIESAAPAASLISGTFAQLRRNNAWEPGMSVRLVRKRAEQYVAGYTRLPRHETMVAGDAAPGPQPEAVGETGSVQPFDVIFIDPPYAFTTEACNRLLADLATSGLAVSGTVIVLERSTRSDEPKPPAGWRITDRRDYGETAVHYIEAV